MPLLNSMKKDKPWYVYMVRCKDGTIYTGISNEVEDRINKHNSGQGAKYTASRSPVTLIFQEKHRDRVSAMKREIRIKTWSRGRKEALSKIKFSRD
ncbi:MAG: GIY-YIG nuclease family protein [Nitrospiria bacterium]